MNSKLGRNDLCHCGSGKKYKKCCLAKDAAAQEYYVTGTGLDHYMHLYKGIALFGQTELQGPHKKELDDAHKMFEKRYRPGNKDGLTDSIFMTWYYLDFRYGKERMSIGERMLKSDLIRELCDPGPQMLSQIVNSYYAMYEVLENSGTELTLEELATGRKWQVHTIGEQYEKEASIGDIWYIRLVGDTKEAYCFGVPFAWPPRTGAEFHRIWKQLWLDWLKKHPGEGDSAVKFREMCKEKLLFWAAYMIRANLPQEPVVPDVLVNREGHRLRSVRLEFKIISLESMKRSLSRLASFEYNATDDCWSWLARKRKNESALGRTMRGVLRIKGETLVAELNSLERSRELQDIIEQRLAGAVVFKKCESTELADLPQLTESEQSAFEEKQKQLNENPEIKKALVERMDAYYCTEWIRTKIPALGNKTPLQMVSTEQGKERVEQLLKEMEEKSTAPVFHNAFDREKIRKALKLC